MNFEVCTLGTASGLPAPHRFGQTIVVTRHDEESGDSHFILDTGDGASSLLMRNGFDHRRIHGIFISHMHADHHTGLAQVLKTCMHLRKQDELVIFAPDEGIAAFKAYFDASYLFEEWFGFPIRWVPLSGLSEQGADLYGGGTLRAYPNAHLNWVREEIVDYPRLHAQVHTFESYSAVYDADGYRVVYSGNLDGPKGMDEMDPYIEPCDILIAELAHVDPTELGRSIAGRDIGQTVVVHFNPYWDNIPDAEIHARVIAGAGTRGIRGTVTIAHDGDRFVSGPS